MLSIYRRGISAYDASEARDANKPEPNKIWRTEKMINLKKLLTLILAAVMVMTVLAACGKAEAPEAQA